MIVLTAIWNFWQRLTLQSQIVIIVLFVSIVAFGYLLYAKRSAESQAEQMKTEKERLERQNDGLKILVNTANIAVEIEKQKEVANVQKNTSKNANAVYANSRVRDSNTFSNSFSTAKQQFCAEFPADSLCQ